MENINNEDIKSLQKFVSKDFLIDEDTSLIPNSDFEKLEEFKKYLIQRLNEMLNNNFNLLVNTLYRIDISEQKLAELFGNKNKENIPEKLADMIIERQMQKIQFRKKYREGKL
ncbi:MAG: hypothetical protein N3D80_10265 [Ignavibacterium album]|jgi:hypothetical protein|uniref:hypothetical protein n=1 Tax=Ignavibacterium album TaxID=591197 RepID=UPI0026EC94B7|nr:hypothetical protein [Ignavibacterium album]MCX8106239.1 hypothetical protein [Ignavibacterium album]